MRIVRNVLVCALVVLTASAAAVLFTGPTADTGAARDVRQPLLIHYAQSFPSTQRVAAHREWYSSLPFDGLVVGANRVDPVAFFDPSVSYSEREILAEVRRLPADMGTVRHNFFGLRLIAPLDWSDDAQWQRIESNLRNLARALHESGRAWDGIFLDNEWYGDTTSPWDYGAGHEDWVYSDTEGATPGLRPAEARRLVRARGRQVMDAMVGAWPGIVVFNSQGLSISEPATSTVLQAAGVPDNDVAFANELSGSFTLGMMEAAWGTAASVVDGGRFYGLRTPAQFRTARAWVRHGVATHEGAELSAREAKRYSANVSVSFGVYDRDQALEDWPTVPPAELGERTRTALQECDRYVWLYTEKYEWGKGPSWKDPVPSAYLVAVAAARAAARLNRPWPGEVGAP